MSDTKIYKFHTDKKTYYYTAIYIIILIIIGIALYYMSEGGYLSAWFVSIVVSIFALIALSIPRRIIVNSESVTIQCILEVVEIPCESIVSINEVSNTYCKWMLPLLGGWGFFGYYGIFLDIIDFDRVKVYTTEWNNLVEIIDEYDEKYYISCRQRDELISSN